MTVRASSENVTGLTFLQYFSNFSKSLFLQNLFLSILELNFSQRSQTDVCHQVLSSSTKPQTGHLISRRGKDENGYEM